jgi:LPS O-antigen subunit length determinant protein (WzzB/FepE family)
MKKNSLKNNDEIDMTEIIKTFWDEKIKILLIIIASISIGISYSNRGQELFQGSLEIKPSSNSEFAVFFPINKFFSTETKKSFYTEINSKTILDKFIKDFMKYEQLIYVLQKKGYIKEEISKLSNVNQQKKLFKYAQLFSIEIIPKKNFDQYFVKFKWHDVDEGIEILIETLNLVSENIDKTVFSDLDRLVKIKKNFVINEDLNRIEYLQEQAEIKLDTEVALNHSNNNNVNPMNFNYYLRGSQAINKEINIIENRQYRKFTQIENEINSLRNNNEIKWVDYNLFLIKVKIIKKSNNFLKISIISGLILAFFYVVIQSALKPKKTAIRKKTN